MSKKILGRNQILKELRALTYKEYETADLEKFVNQVYNKENDRGAAILVATNTENALEYGLLARAFPERRSEFFKSENGLSQFNAKITLCFVLGLVDEKTYSALKIIRDIRNVFAHAKIPVDFETKEIADACSLLKVPPLLPPVGLAALTTPTTNRQLYISVCDAILHNIFVTLIRFPKQGRMAGA